MMNTEKGSPTMGHGIEHRIDRDIRLSNYVNSFMNFSCWSVGLHQKLV